MLNDGYFYKDILVEMGGIELIPKTLSNKALSKINK
jgi:hypothetical protein